MLGLMQDWPMLNHRALDYAAKYHKAREVVTRGVEGDIRRQTYPETRARALKLSKWLDQNGYQLGDRIATLGWNTERHLECWYGIMGIGAIYHTLNPRLFHDQLVYIINHAEDRLMFLDVAFVPMMEELQDRLPMIERFVVLTDKEHMPENSSLRDMTCFEDIITSTHETDFTWAQFDENTAAGLCYTSGTTGNPKGVLYSHRSNMLLSLSVIFPDMLGLSAMDVVMPVVPLFHANGWSLAISTPMVGAKLVMPGPNLDGESLYHLIEQEGVTITAGVPTVWLGLLNYMEKAGKKLSTLQRVVIGGSAAPKAMIEKFQNIYGVHVAHAWGMTEMSPLGSFCSLTPDHNMLSDEEKINLQLKQGRPPFCVDMKITDDDGVERPWDGQTFGKLKVSGPSVCKAYYKADSDSCLDDTGYFDTGDISTMDAQGYMHITDRDKDVIKSGGEWISSIDLENFAMGHPDVAEAAVIGIAHPKWDERPLLVIVKRDGSNPEKQSLIDYLSDKVAKWWLPNDVAFVDEIPHTATGKIQKTVLRDQFKDFEWRD